MTEQPGEDLHAEHPLPQELPGDHCVVHKYHWPLPNRTTQHHIWPLGYGGPTATGNLIWICDTGHANVHDYLAYLLGVASYVPHVTKLERLLAELGEQRIQDRHMNQKVDPRLIPILRASNTFDAGLQDQFSSDRATPEGTPQ